MQGGSLTVKRSAPNEFAFVHELGGLAISAACVLHAYIEAKSPATLRGGRALLPPTPPKRQLRVRNSSTWSGAYPCANKSRACTAAVPPISDKTAPPPAGPETTRLFMGSEVCSI
jgi:hypothetical protein